MDLDKYLDKQLATAPAVAVAAVHAGTTIVQRVVGEGSAGKATIDTTAFLLASISKTFLAVVCAQCVE